MASANSRCPFGFRRLGGIRHSVASAASACQRLWAGLIARRHENAQASGTSFEQPEKPNHQSSPRLRRTQSDQRCAPAAVLRMIERERDNFRMPGEHGVHGAPQISDAFSMNDADLEDAAFLAGGQVLRDEFFYLARLESVQVQHAVNGKLDRLVHRSYRRSRMRVTPCDWRSVIGNGGILALPP